VIRHGMISMDVWVYVMVVAAGDLTFYVYGYFKGKRNR
jgi:hypothetical protein